VHDASGAAVRRSEAPAGYAASHGPRSGRGGAGFWDRRGSDKSGMIPVLACIPLAQSPSFKPRSAASIIASKRATPRLAPTRKRKTAAHHHPAAADRPAEHLINAGAEQLFDKVHLRYWKFESTPLQQTVWVSPRPGRYRSKNPRFRACVRRCGRQRHARLVEIAQSGAVISVGQDFSTAVPLMWLGQYQRRVPTKAGVGRMSQAKSSRVRCSCQVSGRREWASSLSAVRSGG
jgi:hypothetical protein